MPATSSVTFPCFPIPATSSLFDEKDSSILTNINSPINAVTKIEGKKHKSSVNGNLSIATILSNAFLLPGFPRASCAIIQSGQLGLTFSQMDGISKRLALIISSLVLLPGVEYQVNSNNDGDSVVIIILDEEDYVDEQLVVLIFTILRLGATYMILNRNDIASDINYWYQVLNLIEPILVVTTGDPQDLPTAVRNDLNLVSREHFEDFQEEEEYMNDMNDLTSNSSSVTDTTSPLAASSTLVKKIQSSFILRPSNYKPAAASIKILWDLAMELKIGADKEKDLQVLHFRSETQIGQRTAMIFPCWAPFQSSGSSHQWCRLGHKAIRNRISWERMEFPMKPSEKVCLTFPLQDPRSLVQIFNSFVHGKALILGECGEFHNGGFFLRKFRTESFRNLIRIELTPERLQELLDTAAHSGMEHTLGKIKMWLISSNSGLQLPLVKYFFQSMKGFNDVILVTTYGKAECLWCATWKLFRNMSDVLRNVQQEKDGSSRLVMGVPVINTMVYIVDERKNMFCSLAQKGQIWITGSMVPSNGYSGAPVLGRNSNQIFSTGDYGKIIQDKSGGLQLVVDGDLEHPVLLKGKLIDLEDMTKQIKRDDKIIRDAHAFVCRRGRDVPEIVVAVVSVDPMRTSPVVEAVTDMDPMISGCFPVTHIPKTTEGYVDVKQLRASYFKHLGRCSSRQWSILVPRKNVAIADNSADEDFIKNIQIICKAVAFSVGITLTEVIENFEKGFWELGGSSLRAIMTVKSCQCQGKKLSIEDFVSANLISELGFRLVLAEKDDMAWYQDNTTIRQSFIYSRMTKSDHRNIFEVLLTNLKKVTGIDNREMEKYAHGLLEIFDNSLGVVALTSDKREIIGVALNFRGSMKFHFVPSILEEGVELFTSVLGSCKHLTHGIDNKNLAKSYIFAVRIAPYHQILTPPQTMILLRDIIKESIQNAESVGCRGYMVCTMDPIVQEICCSLLGFEMLAEVQLNMYKNKKLQKPFIHFDDHQVIGVYFKKIQDPNL